MFFIEQHFSTGLYPLNFILINTGIFVCSLKKMKVTIFHIFITVDQSCKTAMPGVSKQLHQASITLAYNCWIRTMEYVRIYKNIYWCCIIHNYFLVANFPWHIIFPNYLNIFALFLHLIILFIFSNPFCDIHLGTIGFYFNLKTSFRHWWDLCNYVLHKWYEWFIWVF